jgi:hypothetical protein
MPILKKLKSMLDEAKVRTKSTCMGVLPGSLKIHVDTARASLGASDGRVGNRG